MNIMRKFLFLFLFASVAIAQPPQSVTKGGTGNSTFPVGSLLIGNGISPLLHLSASTNSYILTMVSGSPAWAAFPGLVAANNLSELTSVTTALDNLTLGTSNDVEFRGLKINTFSTGVVKSNSLGVLSSSLINNSDVALGGLNFNNLPQIPTGTVFGNVSGHLEYADAITGSQLRTLQGLGSAALASTSDFEVPLTFSAGLTRTVNSVSVNTSQNIAKLSNLTSNGFVKTSGSDGTLSIDNSTYLTTAVTSVALTVPSFLSVAGSPITTTGTLAVTLASQSQNLFFASPNGSSGTPTFRSIVAADVPTLNQNTTGSAATLTTARAIYGNNFDGSAALTQIIASTYGGTGNGFTKFTGPTTSEKTFTLPNASSTILTDNAAVTILQGGTGQTTANAALNALLPSQTSQTGKYLQTDGSNTSWVSQSGTGTVTSVDMTVPSILSISGNPITTTGTLALSLATQTANKVFAGPTSGGVATPTFRSLVAADIPGIDLLLPTQTGHGGEFLITNGTAASWAATSGGMSIGGTVTSGTAGSILYVATGPVLAQDNSNFFYDATNKALMIGGGSLLTGSRLSVSATTNGTLQANVQNLSNGGSASSDFVATADNGNNSQLYIDMGINSSGYNDAQYTITGANAGYLYTNGGNLAIGTQTAHDIIFHTDSTLSTNERWRITHTTGLLTGTQTIAANTIADGLLLKNPATASSGNQMYSPALHFQGAGWKTTATAASQSVDWKVEAQPVQGSTNPTATLAFGWSVNGGAYSSNNAVTFTSAGGYMRIGALSNGILGYDASTGLSNNALATNRIPFAASSSTLSSSGDFTFITTSGMVARALSALTNTVLDVLTIGQDGGTVANGFGAGTLTTLESSTTNAQNASRVFTSWTDATQATRTAKWGLQLVNNAAALATVFEISGAGVATITNLASGAMYSASGVVSSETALSVSRGGTGQTVAGSYAKGITSNFTTTSATLVDVTGLSFAIGASEKWVVVVRARGNTSATASIQFGFTAPSGATITGNQTRVSNAYATPTAITALATATTAIALTNDAYYADIQVEIVNSTNAGTVQLQAQSSDGTNTAYVSVGSVLRAYREF